MSRLEELFRPYLPIKRAPGGERFLSARDSRGSYEAETAAELREEVEAQEEPPQSMTVAVGGRDVYGRHYDLAVTAASDRSYAGLYADDEATLNHVATRLLELFARAASNKREGIEWEPNWRRDGLELHLTTPGARRARWTQPLRAFLYDPWTIAIGAAVIAGVILWLLRGS